MQQSQEMVLREVKTNKLLVQLTKRETVPKLAESKLSRETLQQTPKKEYYQRIL